MGRRQALLGEYPRRTMPPHEVPRCSVLSKGEVFEGLGLALLGEYPRRTKALVIPGTSPAHPVAKGDSEPVGRRYGPRQHKGFCVNQQLPGGALVVPTTVFRPAVTVYAARAIGNSAQQQVASQARPGFVILALSSPARSSHGYAYGPKPATTQALCSSFLLGSGRVVAWFCATGQAPFDAAGGHTSALRAPARLRLEEIW